MALRKAKIVYSFGLSECYRVKSKYMVFFTEAKLHKHVHSFTENNKKQPSEPEKQG